MANNINNTSSSVVSSSTSRHYYQGGYDYEFSDDASRFECPICLMCQRDPHQTSCGHRFCYSCILTWLREGKTCPKDNCTLGEGDLFPDPMARREILQLRVRCPTRRQRTNNASTASSSIAATSDGCQVLIRLADVEHHVAQCQHNGTNKKRNPSSSSAARVLPPSRCHTCGECVTEEESDSAGHGQSIICPNAMVACPYTSAGCEEKVARKDMEHHEKTKLQKHLKLLCERMLKLQQTQGSALSVVTAATTATPTAAASSHSTTEDGYLSESESLPSGAEGGLLVRAEEIRLSGSNFQSTQKLLRDLFHRLVQVEQRSCQLQIASEQLSARFAEMSARVDQRNIEDIGRFCRGDYLWRISNFTEEQNKMRHNRNLWRFSPPFYTAPFGYKMCLRCNISIMDGEEYLGMFVHLMRGDHDDCLTWPFSGVMTMSIVNLRRENDDLKDVMNSSDSASNALARVPTSSSSANCVNNYGYGIKAFARVNTLYSGGFVGADGSLAVRALVREEQQDQKRYRAFEQDIHDPYNDCL